MLEYQEDRLKIIQEILPLLGDNFVLKGGTALKLFVGLIAILKILIWIAKAPI